MEGHLCGLSEERFGGPFSRQVDDAAADGIGRQALRRQARDDARRRVRQGGLLPFARHVGGVAHP